uniref:Uncharacterized protein n=1 Tax=Trypanosoma congolense (strain IL3000) TaxID=1068625 RepID=G0URS1_TRYCI|nr:conserved hypothetical protein [Trypanosoma congolense IL3000]
MMMGTVKPEVAIAVLSICGVLLLILIALLIYMYCLRGGKHDYVDYPLYRGFKKHNFFEIVCTPGPGFYSVPLEVRLHTSHAEACDILVDVQYVPPHVNERHMGGVPPGVRLLSANEHYGEQYLLYSQPLVLVNPGRYVISAHTVSSSKRFVGAVHRFCFDLGQRDIHSESPSEEMNLINTQANTLGGDCLSPRHRDVMAEDDTTLRHRPLPPRIIPSEGEVTTFTPIVIAPNKESTTPDQIRYSVDGTYPSLLYTGPFTLSVPPPSSDDMGSSVPIVVRAMVVSSWGCGTASDVVHANLSVYKAGHNFMDPQVPTPVARVHAVDAKLYFDESQRPPNTSILYQLVYVSEARTKPKFSRRRGTVYAGESIPLSEDVAFIYAWTFVGDVGGSRGVVELDEIDGERRRHVRSSAAVYDCHRGTTWNRETRDGVGSSLQRSDRGGSELPPPTICISCSEIDVYFEEPPGGGVVCYTLDRTEPAVPTSAVATVHTASPSLGGPAGVQTHKSTGPNLSTYVYNPNQPIRVTLLQTDQVFLTARTFIPVVDPAAGGAVTCYRFSDRFYRGFTTQ